MARIVHFEIPAENPEILLQFYADVFGWKFQQWGSESYWMTQTGEGLGIEGAILARQHPGQPVVNTLGVDDLDATAEQIKANGGEIVVERMPVPGAGWLAYFKDPAGHLHGIFQSDESAK